jgi:hypothetical protein
MFKNWLDKQENRSFINWAISTNIEDFIPLHLIEFAQPAEEKPQYPEFGVLTPGEDNPKTAKNPETEETYMGAVLHLEPYVGSGTNTCPWATAIYSIIVDNSVDSKTLELIRNSAEYEDMGDGTHQFLGLEVKLKNAGKISDTLLPAEQQRTCPVIMNIRLPGQNRRDWTTGSLIKLDRGKIMATSLIGGCANACLHTAGNPAYASAKLSARRRRTEELKSNQPKFMAKILLDVFRLSQKATDQGHKPVIRLNGTSDESWESDSYRFPKIPQETEKMIRDTWLSETGMPMKRIRSDLGKHIASIVDSPSEKFENLIPYIAKFVSGKTLIEAFRNIQWYDYTKDPSRMMRFLRTKQGKRNNWSSNYHLTFSLAEDNRLMAKKILREGGNVAVVFNVENTIGKYAKKGALPKKWAGFPVFDADKHDFRFLDLPGHVSGLRAKAEAQYRSEDFGFVIQPDDPDLDPNDPAVIEAKRYLQEFERRIGEKEIKGPGRFKTSMKKGAEKQNIPYYIR